MIGEIEDIHELIRRLRHLGLSFAEISRQTGKTLHYVAMVCKGSKCL